MKRPVFILMLALILGEVIAIAGVQKIIFVLIVPILVMQKNIAKKNGFFLAVFFVFMALGFWRFEKEKELIQKVETINGRTIEMEGVYDKCIEKQYENQYYLKDVVVRWGDEEITLKNAVFESDKLLKYRLGDCLYVKGKACMFSVATNKGNFDAKNYYKSLGIYLTVKSDYVRCIDKAEFSYKQIMNDLRNRTKQVFDEICFGNQDGIYNAVLLGDKTQIDENIKYLYETAGISHILAVSGLHIAAVGICIFKMLRKKLKYVGAGIISTFFVISFVLVTGSSVSAIRAAGMFLFYLMAQALGRKYDMLNAISFVTISMVLDNPFILFNTAFLMSFMAVYAIIFVNPLLKGFLLKETVKQKRDEGKKRIVLIKDKAISYIKESVLISLSINLLLLPIISYNYFQIPIYSITLNIIVLPFVGVVLGTGFAAMGSYYLLTSFMTLNMALTVSKIIIFPGAIILNVYELLSRLFIKIPGNILLTGRPDKSQIVIYYLLLSVTLLILKGYVKHKIIKQKLKREDYGNGIKIHIVDKKHRVQMFVNKLIKSAIVVGTYLVFVNLLKFSTGNELQIQILDVGQGECILITKDDFVVMVDCGSTDTNGIYTYRIKPCLKSQGINTIDYVFITHTDTDHISGIMEMLQDQESDRIVVDNMILPIGIEHDEIYERLVCMAVEDNVKVSGVCAGNEIIYDELKVKCLHPGIDYQDTDKNSYSTVLDLRYKQFSMLFTGDISVEEEKYISTGNKAYTVLKVAHHGSRNSTSNEFLERTMPGIAVVSCGYKNQYGHPHKELIDRLHLSECSVFRTDMNGEIELYTDGEEIRVFCHGNR